MGGGSWSADTYAATTTRNIAAGTAMGYDAGIKAGTIKAEVNEKLDPKKTAGSASPLAGKIVREARDSTEHPNSVPIIVAFDQTGSMGHVPREFQKSLAELFGLLLRKGYVTDPQLCIGAYGDMENREKAPVQIGQFESDNRADETLDALYLEGHGGGNRGETASGIWYYAATYTATDAWEKRGKKGYLFTIGDEVTFGIKKDLWKQYVDPDCTLEADLTPQQVADLAKERWEVFHVVINNYAARDQDSIRTYTDLLGPDRVLVLQDSKNVCDTIALAIGLCEGMIDLDDGLEDLDDVGSHADKGEISKALAVVGAGGGAVTRTETPADIDSTSPASSRL